MVVGSIPSLVNPKVIEMGAIAKSKGLPTPKSNTPSVQGAKPSVLGVGLGLGSLSDSLTWLGWFSGSSLGLVAH